MRNKTLALEYNTNRNKLVFREYGRNIQKLIEYAVNVQEQSERQKVVDYIIELMGQTNPHLKNVEEFRHKLYDHLFIVSDFKLDIDSPYPIPTKEQFFQKPKPIPYPKTKTSYRHYGHFVERMIDKAVQMEDAEKKEAYTTVIGNYMKLVYHQWNNEIVNDLIIKQDLEKLSGGKLTIADETTLDTPTPVKKPPRNTRGQQHRKSKTQGRGNFHRKRKK